MTVTELSGCKITVVCIYRAPDGNFREFLSKLELVIQKRSMKGRQLILCGDWNLNLLQENVKLNELKSLLEVYNLVNAVDLPTKNYKEY
jgi:exonuclease III